jgi:hypothetical protein
MAKSAPIWERERPLRSALRIVALIVFSPLLLVALLLSPVFWLVRKLFPPALRSAADMVATLTVMIEGGDDPYAIDDALNDLHDDFATSELEAMRRKVLQLGDPPWTAEQIDELKAMRDSARALSGGQV